MSILNERAPQAARMGGFTLAEVTTVMAILGFLFLVLGMTPGRTRTSTAGSRPTGRWLRTI